MHQANLRVEGGSATDFKVGWVLQLRAFQRTCAPQRLPRPAPPCGVAATVAPCHVQRPVWVDLTRLTSLRRFLFARRTLTIPCVAQAGKV
jgi:hypothetical protein